MPYELKKALSVAGDNIANGTIVQTAIEDGQSVRELMAGNGWPDMVQATFERTNCGDSFSLVAETYHGSGGYWTCGSVEQRTSRQTQPRGWLARLFGRRQN